MPLHPEHDAIVFGYVEACRLLRRLEADTGDVIEHPDHGRVIVTRVQYDDDFATHVIARPFPHVLSEAA